MCEPLREGMGGSSHISSSISPFFRDVLAALMFAASPLTVVDLSVQQSECPVVVSLCRNTFLNLKYH